MSIYGHFIAAIDSVVVIKWQQWHEMCLTFAQKLTTEYYMGTYPSFVAVIIYLLSCPGIAVTRELYGDKIQLQRCSLHWSGLIKDLITK